MLGVLLLLQLTVAVGGSPSSPEYLPVRVAESAGLFARENLTVILRTTRAESGAAEALAQGQADLAVTSLEAVLRFAHRPSAPLPRLLFGLTAAPPVALMVPTVHADTVRSVSDLAKQKIGLVSPGGPEHTWLQAVLARSNLTTAQVDLLALGSRGLAAALDVGEIQAGLVVEPLITRLQQDRRAVVLVDLRSPPAVERAVGAPTVNAAVFVRADLRLSEGDLTAFVRALLAAERLITTETASALAPRLPQSVLALGDEYDAWLASVRSLYLPNGLVSPEALKQTVEIIRAHLPLPRTLKIPRPEDMLNQGPLRRALRARPPA